MKLKSPQRSIQEVKSIKFVLHFHHPVCLCLAGPPFLMAKKFFIAKNTKLAYNILFYHGYWRFCQKWLKYGLLTVLSGKLVYFKYVCDELIANNL